MIDVLTYFKKLLFANKQKITLFFHKEANLQEEIRLLEYIGTMPLICMFLSAKNLCHFP